MSVKLFIGGLSWSTDDDSLRTAFEAYGEVVDAKVVMDRDTGKSRGFGFVTFASADEASAAKSNLNQIELDGREIRVDDASDRDSGGGRGGFRGGSRGGGGFRGGRGGGYGGDRGGGRSSFGNRDRPYDRDNTRGSYDRDRSSGGGSSSGGGGRRRYDDGDE